MLDTDPTSTNLTLSSPSTGSAVRPAPIADEPTGLLLTVNGIDVRLPDDPRVSLLDLLRERLHLTGTKKGCDQGACGACTVLADGERILSCLALAVQYQGRCITTIEGLGTDVEPHPLQRAFIEHDGFQCGYCTPGHRSGGRDKAPRGLDLRAEAGGSSDRDPDEGERLRAVS